MALRWGSVSDRLQDPATGRVCTGVLLRVGRFRPRSSEPQAPSPSIDAPFVRSPLYTSDDDSSERGSGAAQLPPRAASAQPRAA